MDDFISIKKSMENSRQELLDIGLRGNTLLHFKFRAKSLEVIDEISQEIFRILVTEQKSMSFIPIPESLANEEDDEDDSSQPLPAILEELYGDKRHSDTKLQTKLVADKLDKKLLKISNEAATYFQETGVDILYLAVGFLNWYEDQNSEKKRKAPLVLIPVSLERGSARERFKVSYTQADIGPNLTLAAKMKNDFRIVIPEFDEDIDVESYFNEVSERITSQNRWSVSHNEIGLGFFSFGKFRMYQDLNPDVWPEGKEPHHHSIIKELLGENPFNEDKEGQYIPLDDEELPVSGLQDLTELYFVKDADSSQTKAVSLVKTGSNLVIQGPPGTGKSQTITNIISEFLAENKTVLFVAEKMAALEVVKQRLDECWLGAAVLELHSHKSNKRSILEELKRTMELGQPDVKDHTFEKNRHIQLRKQLDEYCHKVNQPILKSGTSYIDALGHFLSLYKESGDNDLPVIDFSVYRDWDKSAFTEACSDILEMVEHLRDLGIPEKNPFAQSTLTSFSPWEQTQIETLIKETVVCAERLQASGKDLAGKLGLEDPKTIIAANQVYSSAKLTLKMPELYGLNIDTEGWTDHQKIIKELIQLGSEIIAIRATFKSRLIDQAWESEVEDIRYIWDTKGSRWWRFLSKEFREAKYMLQDLLVGNIPENPDECLELLDAILTYQKLLDRFVEQSNFGENLFGAYWQNTNSDWTYLKDVSDWLAAIHQAIRKKIIPREFLHYCGMKDRTVLVGCEQQINLLLKDTKFFKEHIENIYKVLGIHVLEKDEKKSIIGQTIYSLLNTLNKWSDSFQSLYQMTRYNQIYQKLRNNGLDQIAKLSFSWMFPPELLLVAFKKSWYGGLVQVAYLENEELKFFDRLRHENSIGEFKSLDSALFQYAQEAVVLNHYKNLPHANAAGEMAILNHEMQKKRRHKPIRRLLAEAGRAIQKIKPVFMMSPMSIATYLQQGDLEFDLVIFDEASQVKVVDALGAILRGRQVVVVGDTKQMPPTDFFNKTIELDDDEAEESKTADIESILGMFLSKGSPQSMLRWHYRSRHDSLIAVSNREFYEGRLMIFPSPGVNPQAKGLKFRHLPETIYERGGSRTNPLEARIVAEAVMVHAKQFPTLTLGVAAFSTAQRDCILLEIERFRRNDPTCEHFFNVQGIEGFFVKNLENVQGDERDVIFISIGYGRTGEGKLPKNFGPVNRDGGERRLNVLITRARLSMEVFCNFTAADLDTQSDSPFGVRALKSFLYYAETGDFENRTETGKETDSPFEDEVILSIQQMGYTVEPQVGSAGFYIDIAVKDPKKPGRYILAVECDGASYHSSATARDRDRLRQSVLEGLGWRFHRIWSTDWFRFRDKEVSRLQEAIEKSIRYYTEYYVRKEKVEQQQGSDNPYEIVNITRSEVKNSNRLKAKNYSIARGSFGLQYNVELHTQELFRVEKAIQKIVEQEGPVHIKVVAKRIADSIGFARVGSRMRDYILYAVKQGKKNHLFHFENDFLYTDSKKQVQVRDRSKLPVSVKKIELVSKEEMQEAFILVVTAAFSLSEEEAVSAALSLMGFGKATAVVTG
ncbi:MAG: DUF3320 domain-containing protein, partial [Spirochaetales bacterium]|nr:DUF3320 domain-containing protein [Spirochaetales bacterium]